MYSSQIETIIAVVSAIGALLVATSTLVWFISTQFKSAREEFWKGISSLHNTITTMLNNHEKDDDRRFERISDQLLDIERRNARKDGDPMPTTRKRKLDDHD